MMGVWFCIITRFFFFFSGHFFYLEFIFKYCTKKSSYTFSYSWLAKLITVMLMLISKTKSKGMKFDLLKYEYFSPFFIFNEFYLKTKLPQNSVRIDIACRGKTSRSVSFLLEEIITLQRVARVISPIRCHGKG